MQKGVVKFFNESKGFGFITDEESNQDFFVHISNLSEDIQEKDEVEFEIAEGKKGLMAVDVRVINE